MTAVQAELWRWHLAHSSETDPVVANALAQAGACAPLHQLLVTAAGQWAGSRDAGATQQRQELALWLLAQLPDLSPEDLVAATAFFGTLLGRPCHLEALAEPGRDWPELLPLGRHQLRTSPADLALTTEEADQPPRPSLRGFEWFTPTLIDALDDATTAAERGQKLIGLADELCAAALKKPMPEVERLNAALQTLRDLAADDQAEFTPAGWSFAPNLPAEPFENGQAETAYRFNPLVPSGQVVSVHRLGWQGPSADLHRTAQVLISAGPTIEAVRTCQKALAQVADPAVEPLREQVDDWFRRLRYDILDDALKEFFLALHADDLQPWRDQDDGTFSAVQEAVSILLEDRLGYRSFSPQRRGEYRENYVIAVGNKPSRTGRVCRVLQPGLMDQQGRLILPARVEEE